MKGFIKRISLLSILVAVFLTGCGEKLIELTDNEEAVVANMASSIVSKVNTAQKSGLTYLPPEEEPDGSQEENDEIPQDTEADKTPEEEPESGNDNAPENTAAEPEHIVTLSAAIGLADIEANYVDNEIQKYYIGSGYSLEANAGNTFLVLQVSLTNTSADVKECDLLNAGLKYQININNSIQKEAQVTLMLDDLSTFVGSIDPGQSVNTSLIFELEEGAVKDIQSMKLAVNKDNTEYIVEL